MRIREINIAWFWLAVILTVCSMTVQAQDPTPRNLQKRYNN